MGQVSEAVLQQGFPREAHYVGSPKVGRGDEVHLTTFTHADNHLKSN